MGNAVTSKGQVTIPKAVRGRLGIRTGSRVEFRIVGDHAELYLSDPPVAVPGDGFGLLKSRRASVPADLDTATLVRRK